MGGLIVRRGGSWYSGPLYSRAAGRFKYHPGHRNRLQGFRIVEDIGRDRFRVLRGGSWINYSGLLSSSFRHWCVPDFRDSFQGFRVVEDLK